MSNNLNDPREDVLRTDSGVGRYLEEDKRDEKMYIYDAKVLDLCDLPISEYVNYPRMNSWACHRYLNR